MSASAKTLTFRHGRHGNHSSLADMIIVPGDIFDFRHPKTQKIIAEAINLFPATCQQYYSSRVVSFDGKGNLHGQADNRHTRNA